MNQVAAIFDIEQVGQMLILKPAMELHDVDEREIDEAAHELLEQMETSGLTDVFLDFNDAKFPRSKATHLASQLWKCVRSQGGSLAIGLI